MRWHKTQISNTSYIYTSVNFVLISDGLLILFSRTYLTHFQPFKNVTLFSLQMTIRLLQWGD